jgi:hypothetical protein
VNNQRPASDSARLAELELRYLEMQRDLETLSDMVRELDGRVALLSERLDRALQPPDDPLNPDEHGPFDTRW